MDEGTVEEVPGERIEVGRTEMVGSLEFVEEALTKVTVLVVVLVSEMVEVFRDEVVFLFPWSPSVDFALAEVVGFAFALATVLTTALVVAEVVVAVREKALQPAWLHTLVPPERGASPIRRPSHLASQYVVRFSIAELDPVPTKP